MRMKGVFLMVLFCMLSFAGVTQIRVPSMADSSLYKNSISFGPSYGQIVGRDATFWGASIGYAYRLPKNLALAATVAYDQETSKFKSGEDQVINTFTGIATISYLFTKHWSVTTGLAKGMADDDAANKTLGWRNGDWSTGISLGYSLPDFPFWARESFAISAAYEYNISQNEFSYSFDLVMGLSW